MRSGVPTSKTRSAQFWVRSCFAFALILYGFIVAQPQRALAQFSGTVSMGVNGATNVEGIDTASPDVILQPAITLEYMTEFSPITIFKFDFAYNPDIYTITPDHSIRTTTYGVGGTIYLSKIDEIKKEWEDAKKAEKEEKVKEDIAKLAAPSFPHTSISKPMDTSKNAIATDSTTTPKPSTPLTRVAPPAEDQDVADSLIGEVTTLLYSTSEALDSIEFKGKSADALGDLRDSASETISTLADLLDSIPFSESVKEVAVDELKDMRGLIDRATAGLKEHQRILEAIDSTVQWLNKTAPQGDYLPVKETVVISSPISAQSATVPNNSSDTTHPQLKQVKEPGKKTVISIAHVLPELDLEASEQNAPVYSLLNATEQFRNLTSEDFDIVENILPKTATTCATNLQFPCNYELDRNTTDFKIYDFNALTLEATLEAYTSRSFALDLTYDYINSNYQNDSLFTNNENRGRLGIRALLSKSTVLSGEIIAGTKDYTTPIYYSDTVTVPDKKNKDIKQVQLTSTFQLYVFGLGLTHFFDKDANLGGLLDFSANPNLRFFVTPLSNRARQQAAGITDDEYTYRMSRIMLFTNERIFWSLDFGLDVTGERRKYGSVLNKDNAAIINETGADRSEGDLFIHADLSRTFTYDDARALSLFDLVTIEAALSYSKVTSTAPSGRALPLYSYNDTEGTLTLTLGF